MLWKRASADEPGWPAPYRMNTQYRMCETLKNLANAVTYQGAMQCGKPDGPAFEDGKRLDSLRVRAVWARDKPVVLWHCGADPAGALQNSKEVCAAKALLDDLGQMGCEKEEVAIITLYREQVAAMSRKLQRETWTVDSAQGREKDVVILSMVRAKTTSFLEDEKRLNVALTRAKRKLIILASEELLRSAQGGALQRLRDFCTSDPGAVRVEGDAADCRIAPPAPQA